MSSLRRSCALSQSKIPPQQRQRLLNIVDLRLRLRPHSFLAANVKPPHCDQSQCLGNNKFVDMLVEAAGARRQLPATAGSIIVVLTALFTDHRIDIGRLRAGLKGFENRGLSTGLGAQTRLGIDAD